MPPGTELFNWAVAFLSGRSKLIHSRLTIFREITKVHSTHLLMFDVRKPSLERFLYRVVLLGCWYRKAHLLDILHDPGAYLFYEFSSIPTILSRFLSNLRASTRCLIKGSFW